MSDNDVYLINNGSGVDQCPSGKLALYTNINYNASEIGNILVISPDIQLNKAQLQSFGFIVGDHDGVSSVVNNMDIDATLVSGLYLDGETLVVSAGKQISSLVNYPLGSGTWNDATQSVVSESVTSVNLLMTLQGDINLASDENYTAILTIDNSSSIAIPGASVDVSASDPTILEIDVANVKVDIPANDSVNLNISLTGGEQGSTSLTCVLNIPIGIVNEGTNKTSTMVTVTAPRDLQVTQSLTTSWQVTWNQPEYNYSYHLVLTSSDESVSSWELSFLLPDGAYLEANWLATNSSWIQLNEDKSIDGYIYLDSISGHVVSPATDLPMDVIITYPGKSDDYNTLKNLRLEQLN